MGRTLAEYEGGEVPCPTSTIAVVIPAFRAAATILPVIAAIGPAVRHIYVVDDACPERTGALVEAEANDPRVRVLSNPRNLGVGGAMKRGYAQALADDAAIIVKVDADGQMEPHHIPRLIAPILAGEADYAKGNRFAPQGEMPPGSCVAALSSMPAARRAANRALTAIHGAATGYWRIDDPANGYTAVHRRALERLGVERLADCFFFETDMLFRLGLIRARVTDVALPALYPEIRSNLTLARVAPRFAWLTASRAMRRMWMMRGTRHLGMTVRGRAGLPAK